MAWTTNRALHQSPFQSSPSSLCIRFPELLNTSVDIYRKLQVLLKNLPIPDLSFYIFPRILNYYSLFVYNTIR